MAGGRRGGRARRVTVAVAAVPLAAVALLAAEAVIAMRRSYLPVPDAAITATVGDAAGTPLRLVVLGDSTVRGVGSSSAGTALPVLVAERVAAAVGRPVEVTGVGVSGARTDDVRDEQARLLRDLEPDVVLVVIGSNDATHATAPWSMREQTRRMLEAVQDAAGPAPVVLGGIPQFATVPALLQPLRWVVGVEATWLRNAQRRAAADAGVPFVDIAGLASPRFVGVPEAMSGDGFHPSDIGYGFWADALAPAVADALHRR